MRLPVTMGIPDTYSYIRYLDAKRTVDDRALNVHVWQHVLQAVRDRPCTPARPLRVVEIGAGIGATLQRFLRDGAPPHVDYTLVDIEPAHLEEAGLRIAAWGAAEGYRIDGPRERPSGLDKADRKVCLSYQAADANAFLEGRDDASCDLLIAQALLDIVDRSILLPNVLRSLGSEGWFYFPIHFDGVTILLPELDAETDARIETCYHSTMDDRDRDPGTKCRSQTGRALLMELPAYGAEVTAVGSSDWIVAPFRGRYVGDEDYFLYHILHFYEDALTGHPELNADEFRQWLAQRRALVTAGELVFIAHQLDLAGRSLSDRNSDRNTYASDVAD